MPLTGSGDEFDRLSGDINGMLDRIGELMDGVRQVSNSIAHDLRTPLTALHGHLEALSGSSAVQQAPLLRAALAGQHGAVTDVSSGFFQVDLRGPRVRDTLAQGCPMDLHPRAFPAHRAVGTHFYKVGLTLWLTAEPSYR
mgnify:CR=1 FL=1